MSVPDLTFAGAPCHRPMIRMIIRHDGEMLNCCEDTHGAWGLGNVHESSLEELWHSERHVRVVQDLIAGHRDRYALCRNCPLTPTGPAPAGEKVTIVPRRYAGDGASQRAHQRPAVCSMTSVAAPYAEPHEVTASTSATSTSSMEIPDYGFIRGPWDHRGGVNAYLGNIDLQGKQVLEVGTASGFYCYEMEKRGSTSVVSYVPSPTTIPGT